jgi:zinc transporter 9
VDADVGQTIRAALEGEAIVESVEDLKSVVLTLGKYSVNAELDFDGRAVADLALERSDLPERLAAEGDPAACREALRDFGEDVITALGDEVDAIEARMREAVPGVQSVDLEAD